MKKLATTYALSVAGFAGVLVAVLHFGSAENSVASSAGRSLLQRLADGLKDPLSLVLLQIVVIVVAARLLGTLFRALGQPAVVGEMLAGIALGPSLVGSLFPNFSEFLFPKSSFANLSTLSQFGILLFMFGVGIELDTKELARKARSAILVSHMSIVVPFGLGTTIALWLYHDYAGSQTAFLPFALFMGISMSITAFPVLARILHERNLVHTPVGSIVVTSAAVDDVTAWCGLAVIVALSRAHNPLNATWTVGLAIVFVICAFTIAKPLLQRLAKVGGEEAEPPASSLVAALVCAFLFGLITEAIGVHAFFGAFVAGVVMPRSPAFRRVLYERMYLVAALVLVPVFFAFTGLRTQIGLLRTPGDWLLCGCVLFCAVLGKLGGGAIAARITGLDWRESFGVGVLMNTRGLVELIALNLGLDLGVLSPKIFAMLVIMALTTTFMTGPLLRALRLDSRAPGFIPSPAPEPSTAA
ncbi:MAG TPA: cation:proton antiporter [Fimbriimonadaceae bacterium]|nr:cation:proton antiporter [Fimbriimonadaceae bacterium]